MPYRIFYYRNYDSEDETVGIYGSMSSSYYEISIDEFSWEPPSGYTFKEWNTNQDGTGTSSQPGDVVVATTRYAIWEALPTPEPYITTDTELTSVANAIRTKGGTSAQLSYPSGFVSAINAIPTGGGGGGLNWTEHIDPQSPISIFNFSMEDYLDSDDVTTPWMLTAYQLYLNPEAEVFLQTLEGEEHIIIFGIGLYNYDGTFVTGDDGSSWCLVNDYGSILAYQILADDGYDPTLVGDVTSFKTLDSI